MTNLLAMGVDRLYTDYPALTMAVKAADDDRDGIADVWEFRYFGTLTNHFDGALSDHDRDGVPDRDEYLAGTDPTDAESCLVVTGLRPLDGASVAVSWKSEYGYYYQVEMTDSLDSPWVAVGVERDATPPVNAYAVPWRGRVCYVRVRSKGLRGRVLFDYLPTP